MGKAPPIIPRRGTTEVSKNRKCQIINPRYNLLHCLIGSVPLGGDNPIRIQSMTNTDTLDTKASVEQCIRIIEAGADFVRLTTQGIREAQNLANIKKELNRAGFYAPLIADIHFNPDAAEVAAAIVEKVRINPGNYTDKEPHLRRLISAKKNTTRSLKEFIPDCYH